MAGRNRHAMVIGYGSIGQRHARFLHELKMDVSLVTQQKKTPFNAFIEIGSALRSKPIDYVVVCDETARHYQTLKDLERNGFVGRVLVEKPLFDRIYPRQVWPFDIFIGYNLRYHPVIRRIEELVKDIPLYSMHVYCGQYLPTWRKDRAYTSCYSSSKKKGGGVLKDLSHELDYIMLIGGQWRNISAKGGKFSNLDIDSDDLFCFLIETEKCPIISLQVNYLDLEPRRQIILNAHGLSLAADLLNGSIEWQSLDGGSGREDFLPNADQTYFDQHQAILNSDFNHTCSFEQGHAVLELIEAAQEASQKMIWIKNSSI